MFGSNDARETYSAEKQVEETLVPQHNGTEYGRSFTVRLRVSVLWLLVAPHEERWGFHLALQAFFIRGSGTKLRY